MERSTVEQRLAEFVTDAVDDVVVAPPAPGDVWVRGKRWQRRRRWVTGVALGCVTAILGGTAWWGAVGGFVPDEVEAAPAASGVPVALPDTLYDVSGWLGRLADGPVVAIQEVWRSSWRGKEWAVAGIAARGGAYGFLDLPGYAEGASLSPDGERVAYWAEGTPTGDPQTSGGQNPVLTALVVRDLVSGVNTRHDIETEHGLAASDIVWLDAETLVAGYGHYAVGDSAPAVEQGSAQRSASLWWHVAEDAPRAWPFRWNATPERSFSVARDGRALILDGNRIRWVDPIAGERQLLRGRGAGGGASTNGYGTLVWAGDGRLAAVGGLKSQSPALVRVAEVTGPDSEVEWRTVEGTRGTFGVLGWRGDDVVTVRSVDDGEVWDSRWWLEFFTVDVEDGTTTPLIGYAESATERLPWQWARDLLETAPVVAGAEPPDPTDPRLVVGLGAGAVVVLVGGLVVWRRRAHP